VTANSKRLTEHERFQHLLTLISSKQFLQMQGLGNEVPFFICAYPASQANEMHQTKRQLINQLEQRGVRILDINLYDLSIALLQERGIWERVLEIEPSVTKDEFKELLQGVLDTETHLMSSIRQMAEAPFDVLFLSGIGEVFPYIRSHNVLNNLQSIATSQPTILFFPGEYIQSLEQGASLRLFGILQDDKYYRAFDIDQVELF
jgi:hypothetical protein